MRSGKLNCHSLEVLTVRVEPDRPALMVWAWGVDAAVVVTIVVNVVSVVNDTIWPWKAGFGNVTFQVVGAVPFQATVDSCCVIVRVAAPEPDCVIIPPPLRER